MAVDININKLRSNSYKLTCSLQWEDDFYHINENAITTAGVVYDFNNNFFPVLHIVVHLPHKIAFLVRERKHDMLVRLIITNISVNIAKTKAINERVENLNSSTMLNQLFQPFNINDNYGKGYDTGLDAYKLGTTNYDENNNYTDTEEMDIYLFSNRGLNVNKKILNRVLGKCDITTAILFLLNKSRVKDAIISPPDNKTIYGKDKKDLTQIILPPLNLKASIDSLQANYGIYETGHYQFMDFNRYYLLDKDYTKPLPLAKGEYETVFININPDDELSASKNGCYKDNEAKCYVVNCYDNTDIIDDSDAMKETVGNQYRIMSRESIKKSVAFDEKSKTFKIGKPYISYNTNESSNKHSKDKIITLYNENGNDYNESMLLNQRIENSTTITIEFSDVDLTYFKPNRKYAIQYKDKNKSKYNGIYRLVNFGYGLTNHDFYIVGQFKKIVEI